MVNHLPAIWETMVPSPGWEGPLEKEIATHSSILAWRIPWTEEPGGLQSIGSHRVGHDRSNLACMPAQRLALSGFTAAVLGSIPGWELRSCKPHGMDKTKKQTKRERILKPFQS